MEESLKHYKIRINVSPLYMDIYTRPDKLLTANTLEDLVIDKFKQENKEHIKDLICKKIKSGKLSLMINLDDFDTVDADPEQVMLIDVDDMKDYRHAVIEHFNELFIVADSDVDYKPHKDMNLVEYLHMKMDGKFTKDEIISILIDAENNHQLEFY